MRVSLFIPCFVDHYFPEVGMSMLRVFEHLGLEVDYPEGQTCCGQPSFNSGYWNESRKVAVRLFDIFEKSEIVVSASGSCGSMIKIFNPELFENTSDFDRAQELAAKTYEFSEFLVDKLGVTDLGARFKSTATFHDSCHSLRELGLKKQARILLSHVQELDLVEMKEAESCCGFGGPFAVQFPQISCAMAEMKSASILETGADTVISNDSSCLMQIDGFMTKEGHPIRTMHLAEVLASR